MFFVPPALAARVSKRRDRGVVGGLIFTGAVVAAVLAAAWLLVPLA